jgi:calcineurin-like phosphoesterase family protein
MRFFTSDQHFGHANILKYEPEARGQFRNTDAMDSAIVDAWNSVVGSDDEVYCVGDMSFKESILRDYLPHLNGRKILIVGNHDPFFKHMIDRKTKEIGIQRSIEAGFAEAHVELLIEVDGIGTAKLSHFPYWPSRPDLCEDYDLRYPDLRPKYEGEDLLLCGHVHSLWREHAEAGRRMLNVGVDVWDMTPISEVQLADHYRKQSHNSRL